MRESFVSVLFHGTTNCGDKGLRLFIFKTILQHGYYSKKRENVVIGTELLKENMDVALNFNFNDLKQLVSVEKCLF